MSPLQHVYRRGHIFWWRRIHRLSGGWTLDVRLSLNTADRREARDRGAALTAASGGVVALLHERIRAVDERPTEAELYAIAKAAYGERLGQFCDEQRHLRHEHDKLSLANVTFADFYQRLMDHGGHQPWTEGEEAFRKLQWGDRRTELLKATVTQVDNGERFPISSRSVDAHLRSHGYKPHNGLRAMVMRALFEPYRDACLDAEAIRLGFEPRSRFADPVQAPTGTGTAVPSSVAPPAPKVPDAWKHVTATEAAERLIAEDPKLSPHRREGKRAKSSVGEQTLRQIRWAAVLIQRSMGGRPFWTLTNEDLRVLDEWFERLPVQMGKAPWQRDPETTLEAICLDAEDKIEAGEYDAGDIGLEVTTTNKHFRKIGQIHAHMRKSMPWLAEPEFGKYISADSKDDRAGRAAYTVEQGEELFRLPPWTGCQSVKERLEFGSSVFHDSLYFVLLLVWYTGMRREEVCKLLVSDVEECGGIWHISIRHTEAGRVKNSSSVRLIALCDELVRLGFLDYFEAIKAAGHSAIFPELVSERKNAKKGDTFYKLWWIYIKPLMPSLKRGQAMHAARHMVDTELKELEIFPEARDDALGHKAQGEGPSRYAKATRLKKLLKIVNQIPVVTSHLPAPAAIQLLPVEHRQPRPQRATRGG